VLLLINKTTTFGLLLDRKKGLGFQDKVGTEMKSYFSPKSQYETNSEITYLYDKPRNSLESI